MFKISLLDNPRERRLLVEGSLTDPWTAELHRAWRAAGLDLQGRKLIIDLTNVIAISRSGENTLIELMREGVKFSCGGVLNRHVIRQLSRRLRGTARELSG